MTQLNYELRQLCKRNPDGSRSTQANRKRMLQMMADQLQELGYKKMRAKSLKPKHVRGLLALWREHDISVGTTKNRMAALRWWAEHVGKSRVVEKDNDAYGIEKRELVATESQAQQLDELKLAQIDDPYVKLSVRLQAEFGLRREESIKFHPSVADAGDEIRLKPSWTKGGRARVIPVLTGRQRKLLNECHELCGGGALIPPKLNYVDQLRRYQAETHRVGFRKLHGLRHEYAQRRFKELAGFACPAAGGYTRDQLRGGWRYRDYKARAIITRELGHRREQVTTVYLGR